MPSATPHCRPRFAGRTTDSTAHSSEDEDAITPAPAIVEEEHSYEESKGQSSRRPQHHRLFRRPGSSASSNADVPHLDLDHRHHAVVTPSLSAPSICGGCSSCNDFDSDPDCSSLEEVDSLSLWRRMLAAQRVYHCYNSARISAALEDEELQSRVPSRACLDLLNDSISQMPAEEAQQVQFFLEYGKMKPARRGGRFWRWRDRQQIVA